MPVHASDVGESFSAGEVVQTVGADSLVGVCGGPAASSARTEPVGGDEAAPEASLGQVAVGVVACGDGDECLQFALRAVGN